MTGEPPVLHRVSVEALCAACRPDSHDATTGGKVATWTWDDAALHMLIHDGERLAAVAECVNAEGIGFMDHAAPILVGSNGHLWDGHHRIVIARAMGIEFVNVEYTNEQPKRRRPRGLDADRKVRILIDHTEPPEAYHQWVWVGQTARLNVNGVGWKGQRGDTWIEVVCNNPDCSGTAFVNPSRAVETAYERGLRP